jgi:hypothetical protein
MATTAYPYASQLRVQSGAKGRAQSIIDVLEERAIAMDDTDRLRILSCTDATTLRSWLARALHVSKVSELFAD